MQRQQYQGTATVAPLAKTARGCAFKTSAPTDGDYGVVVGQPLPITQPARGFMVVDVTGSKLYVRVTDAIVVGGLVTVLGTWKSIALT